MDRLVVSNDNNVLHVAGEIDATTAAHFIEALHETTGGIMIDLAECTFMDSTGITTLLEADMLTRSRGANLVLVSPSDAVVRVLAICGMDEMFTVRAEPAGAC